MSGLPAPRPRSRRRTWAFAAGTAFLVVVVAEVLARATFFLLDGASWRTTQDLLAMRALDVGDTAEIIHPYVGAIYDPDHPAADANVGGIPVVANELGFGHPTPSIQKRSADKLIIGIAGGSVAWHFAYLGAPVLIEKLHSLPGFSGKTAEIVCLAFSGYKQPQQVLAAGYVMSLGGEFDLLINLDGFNELALAEGNQNRGSSPYYPRDWSRRLQDAPDPVRLDEAFALWETRAARQRAARDLQASWFRWMAMRELWWKASDERLRRREAELAAANVAHSVAGRQSFRSTGPLRRYADAAAMYDDFVAVWGNGSRALRALAEGAGADYFHFLQPNQYDLDSKPLSSEEQREAYREESLYRQSIEQGYPLLRRRGEELRGEGVSFYDLSGLFADRTETLYADTCCHLNRRGYELLGEAIAAAVVESLSQPPAEDRHQGR